MMALAIANVYVGRRSTCTPTTRFREAECRFGSDATVEECTT